LGWSFEESLLGPELFMKVHLPGFPTEVSGPIELPDIGELLIYPAFQGIVADDFYKHATDFQRDLFNKVPTRNDRKNVIIRSGVWLLRPGTRSHVNRLGDWHLDGGSNDAHRQPDERVFILSSPCSALTQFNLHPLEVESPPEETFVQLGNRISKDPKKFGVIGRSIEPCRIYTFENHLHKAVDPSRIEFRFFFRVRETDQPGFQTDPVKRLVLKDGSGQEHPNIEYGPDTVSIYYPHHSRS
jgi:hypothetical protein